MKKRIFSQQEKDEFVKDFLSSRQRVSVFCHQNGLAISSFGKWKKDFQERNPAGDKTSFTPLEIVQEKTLPDNDKQEVVARVKVGTLEIDFFSEPSAELLLKLANS